MSEDQGAPATNEIAAAASPSLPARMGLNFLRFLRWFYGVFYLLAGVYKIWIGWGWGDTMRVVFQKRLAQLDPSSFGAIYLDKFGIPFALPVAWVLIVGEIVVGVCFLLGIAMRLNIWLALFITLNIGIGGYYDASLLPFFVIPVLLLLFPSANTPGYDARLQARFPGHWWLK
jgi:thiosulfate dehydrogenase (quinone) large subunit